MEKPEETITDFDRVDQAANPAFFTQFMDKSHTLQPASIYRQRMFKLLDVRPGAALLDVGCGAGNDVQDLARLVGPSGRVVGIDSSATMIQQARARTAEARLPVEFVQADAYQLPFEVAPLMAVSRRVPSSTWLSQTGRLRRWCVWHGWARTLWWRKQILT